ncbi:MAG: P-loop NTPase fold protein [Gammaproteobacteria bacterium]
MDETKNVRKSAAKPSKSRKTRKVAPQTARKPDLSDIKAKSSKRQAQQKKAHLASVIPPGETGNKQSDTITKEKNDHGTAVPDVGALNKVRGLFAKIADLSALTISDGSPYFSKALLTTLQRAGEQTSLVSLEQHAVVDPAAYLRAAILEGLEPPDKSRKWRSANEFLATWLTEQNIPLADQIESVLPSETRPTGAAVAEAVTNPELTDILIHAAEIVQTTHRNQKRIDVRHVLTALLLAPAGRAAFNTLALISEEPVVFFSRCRDRFLEHILSQAAPDESETAWRELLSEELQLDLPPGTIPTPITVFNPAYASDTVTAQDDALGIIHDVRAFAELICLEDLEPPLSIGLFGDWGSGKSFFMDKLATEIDNITQDEAAQASGTFVSNVVHIKFNAWHYADANLWASLTAEFFDQLRVGGYRAQLGNLYGNLVKEVAARVGDAESEATTLNNRQSSLNTEIEDAETQLEQVEQEQQNLPETVFQSEVTTFLDNFLKHHQSDIATAVEILDLDPSIATDPKRLREEARRVAELPGKLQLFQNALLGALQLKDPIAGRFLYTALGFGIISALLSSIDISAMLTNLGSILTLFGGVWKTFQTTSPLIAASTNYSADVRAKEREINAKLAAIRNSIDNLRAERKRVQAEQATRRAFLDRYAPGGVQSESPAALLQYFLYESEDARQFEEHIGLVSRVRRAFEILDSIMKEQTTQSGQQSNLPSLDRIVLYIDDLDRCRDEQVVQVLEAVHLLLAFDLFVVVVGVDARWLEQSLVRFYKDQLSVKSNRQENKAGVLDYLEKIFQIPLWLRPLNFGQGGNYNRLVDSLIGSDVIRLEDARSGIDNLDVVPGTEPMTEIHPVTVTLPEIPEEPPEETRKRIQLSEDEVTLMKTLGPVAGKSPRAVKRYINLYRLLRSQQRGAELEVFLRGSATQSPIYPGVLLLLAIEVGLEPTQAINLTKAIRHLPADEPISTLYNTSLLEGKKSKSTHAEQAKEAQEYLMQFWHSLALDEQKAFTDAFKSVSERMGSKGVIGTLHEQLNGVMRYTFRRTS